MSSESLLLKPARTLSALVVMLPLSQVTGQEKERLAYRSPYAVKFTVPLQDLVGDLEKGERGDFPAERRRCRSPIGHGQGVREKYGPWGPPVRHFPAPQGFGRAVAGLATGSLIAVALRFLQGHGYQHHHLPDWDPPRDWPWWKETRAGHNGKGVDCSNFQQFPAYNLGLGLKPDQCDQVTGRPAPASPAPARTRNHQRRSASTSRVNLRGTGKSTTRI